MRRGARVARPGNIDVGMKVEAIGAARPVHRNQQREPNLTRSQAVRNLAVLDSEG
jgi:hypothetical protein